MTNKLTNFDFKKKLFKRFRNGIINMEKYKGCHIPIWFRCNAGHDFKCKPASVMTHKRNGCPYCNKPYQYKNKKYSNNYFLMRLHKAHGNQIRPLEKYKGSDTKIWFKCVKGHMFRETPNVMYSEGCPDCALKKKRRSLKTVKFIINKYGHHHYKLISNYTSEHRYIWLLHLKCNRTFKVFLGNFEKSPKCPYCYKGYSEKLAAIHKLLPLNVLKKRLYNKFGYKYLYIKGYKGMRKIATFIHLRCGRTFTTTPRSILQGKGKACPHCYQHHKYTQTEIENMVNIRTDGHYYFVDTFINTMSQGWFIHFDCGSFFKSSIDGVINGFSRCHVCRQIKGENAVAKFLQNNDIKYIHSKTFKGCYDRQLLHFDFYLPYFGKNGVCIEFNGIQHYQPVNFGGHMSNNQQKHNFKIQKYHDNLKKQYCVKNGIILISIKTPKRRIVGDITKKVTKVLTKKLLKKH